VSPVRSNAQRRFMYATEEGKTDAPKSVGKEFIDASHGVKNLPEHAHGAKVSKAIAAHGKGAHQIGGPKTRGI
jgi:hypothetical protein